MRAELERRFERGNASTSARSRLSRGPDQGTSALRATVGVVVALVFIVPVSVYALMLAGQPGAAGGSTPVAVPTDSKIAPTPALSASPSPVLAPTTGPSTGPGWPANTASAPFGAISTKIDDIDGDGRPDTEWASQPLGGDLLFGITTASGATVSGEQGFAGGGDRSFVVGRLGNGVVVAITSEHRDSPVYTFSGCAFHRLLGKDLLPGTDGRSHFTLYSENGGGSGGCFKGRLALLTSTTTASTTSTVSAVARFVDVSSTGSKATLTDDTALIARNLDLTRATVS